LSRSGIVPIAHSQDTAGPMARTVRDAAILLSAMTGRDSEDPASVNAPSAGIDYSANLAADELNGKRIGVIRSHHGAGTHPDVEAILTSGIGMIKSQDAIIVENIDIDMAGVSAAEYTVLLYEFKTDLAAYLQRSAAPVTSLDDVIAFNDAHRDDVMPYFGQDVLLAANAMGGLDETAYLDALDASQVFLRRALTQVFESHDLDALLAISNGPAWMTDHVNGDDFRIGSSSYAAISGFPSVTVPAGFVSDLPIGVTFIGEPWSEEQLIGVAYAFEEARRARRAPIVTNEVTKSR